MEYLVVVAGDDERIRRVRARSAEEAMQTVKKALGLAPGTDLRFITNRQIRHEALSRNHAGSERRQYDEPLIREDL